MGQPNDVPTMLVREILRVRKVSADMGAFRAQKLCGKVEKALFIYLAGKSNKDMIIRFEGDARPNAAECGNRR